MALLLTDDEEAILSTLLVVWRSIGNAKRVGQWCVPQTEEHRSEIKSILHDVLDHTCPSIVRYQLIMFNNVRV